MLNIKGLSKKFKNDGKEILVLDDINFEIAEGQFICILGPSGSGKTTLLRCIGGYEKISAGKIFLRGVEISRPGIDRTMVFQSFDQLFSWKTVRANIEYPLRINHIDKKTREERVNKYIEMVGLSTFSSFYPHQLSGGMKQRTAIARALALEPGVLLMDEPFGAVDAQTRKNLQDELINIWARLGTTVIFVTHDIDEAIILSDRILVVSGNGKLKAEVDNQLKRPRIPSMQGFAPMWEDLYHSLGNQPSEAVHE